MEDPDKALKEEFETRLKFVLSPIFNRYLTAFRQSIFDKKQIPGRRFSEKDFEFSFEKHYRLVQESFRNRVFLQSDVVETTPSAQEYFLEKQKFWRLETSKEIAKICSETNVVQAERSIKEAEELLVDSGSFSQFELALTASTFLRRLFDVRKNSIATTETQAPAESTKMNKVEALLQNSELIRSYVVRQVWNSLLDGRERDTHNAASGQIRPIGSPFSIGSSLLYYPGDTRAPAKERVNCRCFLTSELISLR